MNHAAHEPRVVFQCDLHCATIGMSLCDVFFLVEHPVCNIVLRLCCHNVFIIPLLIFTIYKCKSTFYIFPVNNRKITKLLRKDVSIRLRRYSTSS